MAPLPWRARLAVSTAIVLVGSLADVPAAAQQAGDADRRAAQVEARMTDDERFGLLWDYMPTPSRGRPAPTPAHVKAAAAYIAGIPRLGLPELYMTDASLGVTNPKGLRAGDVATALPSGLALAATFDPALARASGAMIGSEARAKGFAVLLAGGVNLTRDWYGGRNFEYLGEDPLLAGTLAGEAVGGIQGEGVISTVKHFVVNSQETLRHTVDARIAEPALQESDLLAFRLAIERGQPGAVMCSYNKINGHSGCGNDWLLNRVLKRDWGFKGWVMSDWGAVDGPRDFIHGTDQESGAQLDRQIWFDKPLRALVASGELSRAGVSDGVQRILRSIYRMGIDRPKTPETIDYVAHGAVARKVAADGIVLLKNDGVLPLANTTQRILVVGMLADRGVMAGGGSSEVTPFGGSAVVIPFGGAGFLAQWGRQAYVASSPLVALAKALPSATFEFDTGYFPEAAAARARHADLVVVFATQWQTESLDATSLNLPQGQDALIGQVAEANRNTVVVLETGNPVAMPWLDRVRGVIEAWYPGQEGGAAIAEVLTGGVNPSGRLPMTFPRSIEQAPRPMVPGLGLPETAPFAVDYVEGADVGYRWFAAKGQTPLFAFGHGLSYTRFEHQALEMKSGKAITARLTVRNIGNRAGADVPQLYLVDRIGKPTLRLVAFDKVMLAPGEARTADVTIDPRLLADWTPSGWKVGAGTYRFALGRSATELGPTREIRVKARLLPR